VRHVHELRPLVRFQGGEQLLAMFIETLELLLRQYRSPEQQISLLLVVLPFLLFDSDIIDTSVS
jgi:hypothetical protein